ncbi:hypothetical protein HK405_013223 [Cladochytrium tenue]|nr:hypothetical protein HK405_013223 [Cladochytrium tenue]
MMMAQASTSAEDIIRRHGVGGGSKSNDVDGGEDMTVAVVMLLSLMIGAFQLLLRAVSAASRTSSLISDPVISGFMAAAGLSVMLAQARPVLGLPPPPPPPPGAPPSPALGGFFRSAIKVLLALPRADALAVATSLTTGLLLAALHAGEAALRAALARRRRRDHAARSTGKTAGQSPAGLQPTTDVLLTVLGMGALSYILRLDPARVPVVGPIPVGLPAPSVPWRILLAPTPPQQPSRLWGLVSLPSLQPYAAELVLGLLPSACLIGLVCFVSAYSIACSFGTYEHATRDVLAPPPAADEQEADESTPILSRRSQSPPLRPPLPQPRPSSRAESDDATEHSGGNKPCTVSDPAARRSLADQEMLALGVASVAGSFMGAHAASGSVSRSAVLADQTPARTPFVSLVCAAAVASAAVVAAPLFRPVPLAALAVIVLVAVSGVAARVTDGRRLWRAAAARISSLRSSTDRRLRRSAAPRRAAWLAVPTTAGRATLPPPPPLPSSSSLPSPLTVVPATNEGDKPVVARHRTATQTARDDIDDDSDAVAAAAPTSALTIDNDNSDTDDDDDDGSASPPAALVDYVVAVEPCACWWATFGGVLVSDAGVGILFGMAVSALLRLLVLVLRAGVPGRRPRPGAAATAASAAASATAAAVPVTSDAAVAVGGSAV